VLSGGTQWLKYRQGLNRLEAEDDTTGSASGGGDQ
jgi:hypothetical protein